MGEGDTDGSLMECLHSCGNDQLTQHGQQKRGSEGEEMREKGDQESFNTKAEVGETASRKK